MKARLLWAARSPLRQHDALFRTALAQLNALLYVCTASFALQVRARRLVSWTLGGCGKEESKHMYLHTHIHIRHKKTGVRPALQLRPTRRAPPLPPPRRLPLAARLLAPLPRYGCTPSRTIHKPAHTSQPTPKVESPTSTQPSSTKSPTIHPHLPTHPPSHPHHKPGWALSSLFLARKARRQSFAATAAVVAHHHQQHHRGAAASSSSGRAAGSDLAAVPLSPGAGDDDIGMLQTLLLDDDGGIEAEEGGVVGRLSRGVRGGYRPPPT